MPPAKKAKLQQTRKEKRKSVALRKIVSSIFLLTKRPDNFFIEEKEIETDGQTGNAEVTVIVRDVEPAAWLKRLKATDAVHQCVSLKKKKISGRKKSLVRRAEKSFHWACYLAYIRATDRKDLTCKAFLDLVIGDAPIQLPDWSRKTKENFIVYDIKFKSFIFRDKSDDDYERSFTEHMC
jgi:hypothetical protein